MSFSARGSILLDVAQARQNVALLSGDLRNLGNTSQAGVSSLSESIVRNEQHFNAMGQSMTVAGAGLTALFGTGLKTAAEFEVGMNRVMALSGATGEEFETLKNQALDLSQTTRYTANEIADAMGFLAMAGFEVNEIMAALPGTLNLAAAAQMDLGRAADLSTNILTSFGLEATELDRVVDMLVMTFTNSNTSMEQLGDAFKYVGPVAMAAGLEFEEVAAALGMLGDAGIQGSMAGTTLRGAITRLINPPAAAAKALDQLGVSTVGANGQMLPLVDILRQFPPVTADSVAAMESLSAAADSVGYDMDGALEAGKSFETILAELEAQGVDTSGMMETLGADAETVGLIMELFGLRAGPGMMALLTQGSDKLEEFTDQIRESGGVAEDVANKQLRGLTGALNLLRAAWQSLMIRAMDSGPIQAIAAFVRMLTSMVSAIARLPGPILGVIATIVGLSGVMLTFGGVFLLLLPRIARTYQAFMLFRQWGGMSRVFTMLTANLAGMNRQMMMMPGPIGRVSTSIAHMFATMRADGPLRTLRSGLMNFVRMHPLLVGMGLVAGAVGLAYKTNFLGIGDAIDGLVGRVRGIADDMRAAFRGSGDAAAIAADQVASFAEATHVVDGVTVYTAFRTNADGEREKVGEIVESYKNADGTTAQVLIQGEDSQYWATIDLATGEISNAEINVEANTAPLHERINASLGVLEQAFRDAGVGWAADIVSNLQGVVSFIAGMASMIRGFFSDLGSILSSLGLDRFAGFFSTMATQIGTAAIVLTPLIIGLKLLIGVVMALLSPVVLVVAAISALVAGVVYAYKNFEPFQKIVDRAAKALRNFARNQVVRFLQDMGRRFSDVVDHVSGFVKGVNDVLRPMDRLRSAASSVGAFLVSAFSSARGAVGSIAPAFEPILNHIRNFIDLVRSVGDLLVAVFNNDGAAAFRALQDIASDALDFIISGFTALPRTIINLFQAIDWGAVWDGLRSAASSAIGWVLDAIRNIDWGALIQGGWSVIRDGINAAWNAITSLDWDEYIDPISWATWIGGKIADIAVWLWEKISGFFPSASVISGTITSISTWLWERIKSFFPNRNVVSGTITSVATWIWSKIKSFFPSANVIRGTITSVADFIWGKIKEFFPAAAVIAGVIADFAEFIWEKIKSFFPASDLISGAISDFGSWLYEKLGSPKLDLPSKGEILNAITFGLIGDDGEGPRVQPVPGSEDWQYVDTNPFAGNINFELTGGLPAPPALMADIENLRSSLQSLVDYNDESWAGIAGVTLAESARARGGSESEFTTMAGTIPGHTASLRSRVQSDFQALQGAVVSNSATARSQASSNFATMLGDTTRSASTIRSRVVSDFSSLQRSVSSSASTTRSTTSSEMSSMNTAVIGHISGMQARSAVQMALMASSADTQGKATSTNLTGWTSGANVRLIAGMGLMVGTVRNAGSAMQAAGLYVGDMAGRGVGDGLYRQLGYVRGAANAIIREVNNAMLSAARIASPSRLTRYVGEMLGMGPVVGMLSKVRDARDAARELIDAAIPDVPQREWDLALSSVPAGGGYGGGTTVIDNSTHTETYVALNDQQFAELLAAKDKANIVHDAMTNRHSASQFRKVGV